MSAPDPARDLAAAQLELEAAARTSAAVDLVTPELRTALGRIDAARAALGRDAGPVAVARLVAEGVPDEAVAAQLGLRLRTVQEYRRRAARG